MHLLHRLGARSAIKLPKNEVGLAGRFFSVWPIQVCLLLGTLAAGAQTTPPPEPVREAAMVFSGATVVAVRAPDSVRVTLQEMSKVLLAQGYRLDSVRATYVTTKARAFAAPAGGLSVPITYTLKVAAQPVGAGTRLLLTGAWVDDRNPKYHFVIPMRWIGPGDQLQDQACFVRADELAKAYPKGQVSYRGKTR